MSDFIKKNISVVAKGEGKARKRGQSSGEGEKQGKCTESKSTEYILGILSLSFSESTLYSEE